MGICSCIVSLSFFSFCFYYAPGVDESMNRGAVSQYKDKRKTIRRFVSVYLNCDDRQKTKIKWAAQRWYFTFCFVYLYTVRLHLDSLIRLHPVHNKNKIRKKKERQCRSIFPFMLFKRNKIKVIRLEPHNDYCLRRKNTRYTHAH